MDFWLIVIFAVIGASGVFSVLVLTGLVRPKQDGTDLVMKYIKEENAKLNKKVEELQSIVSHQSEKINTLQMQIVLLGSSHYDHPYPQWMFDTNLNLMHANKAFENMFLLPTGKDTMELVGARLDQVLDGDTATIYRQNHKWVLSNKKSWEGAIPVSLNGRNEAINVILFPVYSGKQIIGVSGMVIPNRPIENF